MIPVNEPWLGERERELALEAIDSGWISGQGRFIEKFEADWAQVCGRKHGIAVCNGSTALETAVHALDLPRGSEVILPTFTLIACANAVIRCGLRPVFVDADPRTWCMDVEQVQRRITPNTRAIMAVHIYGRPVEMAPLLEIARRHRLRVIEDAAEAHGARYRGRMCGGLGDISTFSFYSSKIVSTGEGGMAVCNDDRLAGRCRDYRNLYFGENARFQHADLGHNFRFNNIQAAIGCAQIERLPEALRRKARIGRRYGALLADVPDLQLPPAPDETDNVYWVYGVVLGESHPGDAADLARRLRERGVATRPFFVGLHEQPALRARGLVGGERFPVAERLARRGLYLPSGLTITEAQLVAVAEALRESLVVRGRRTA